MQNYAYYFIPTSYCFEIGPSESKLGNNPNSLNACLKYRKDTENLKTLNRLFSTDYIRHEPLKLYAKN